MAEFNRLDIPGAVNRGRMNALALEQQEQNVALGDKKNALADLSIESGQMANTQAKTTFDQGQAAERARVLDQMADALKAMPIESRPDALARISQRFPEFKILSQIDPQFLTDQGLDMLKAEASSARNDPQKYISAKQREFESLTSGLSPEDKKRARRIELRLDPGAVGNADLTIADQGKSDVVADSKSTIEGSVTRSKENAKDIQEITQQSYESLQAVKANLSQLDEGIRLLNEGASVGAVQSKFPSIKAASVKLDNLKTRLGLDVVAGGKFGPLSEGELKLALNVAVPDKLDTPELKKWFNEKKQAQEKLANYLDETIQFLNAPGVTIADLASYHKARGQQGEAVNTTTQQAQATTTPQSAPTPQTEEEYNALPSGSIYIDPDDGRQYRKP